MYLHNGFEFVKGAYWADMYFSNGHYLAGTEMIKTINRSKKDISRGDKAIIK